MNLSYFLFSEKRRKNADDAELFLSLIEYLEYLTTPVYYFVKFILCNSEDNIINLKKTMHLGH